MTITSCGECRVLNVGEMEIWDGADLSLLRETIRRLFEEEKCSSLGIDMSYVKYVPSGFFGELCDWHDKGVCIRLFGTLPRVKQMLWFTKFFHSIGDGFHELRPLVEDEFSEQIPECAPSQEHLTSDHSSLAAKETRTSNAPIQAKGNADFSSNMPLL